MKPSYNPDVAIESAFEEGEQKERERILGLLDKLIEDSKKWVVNDNWPDILQGFKEDIESGE